VTTTKQRGTEITPVLSTARQIFLQYTRCIWNFSCNIQGIFGIFQVTSNLNLFIPWYLTEPWLGNIGHKPDNISSLSLLYFLSTASRPLACTTEL